MGVLLFIGIIIALCYFTKKRICDDVDKTPSKREWKSNWKWNEETQMWEHPNGQKVPGKKTDTKADQQATGWVQPETPNPETDDKHIDYTKQYQPKYLLSRNEWYQYKKLKEIADIKNLVICPKVRLLDIIEPRHDCYSYKGCLGKISSKHVDFVICDQDMHIKAIIELDDSSHDTQKGKERDRFVNQTLTNVGYTVIRTRYINNNILDLV